MRHIKVVDVEHLHMAGSVDQVSEIHALSMDEDALFIDECKLHYLHCLWQERIRCSISQSTHVVRI